RNHSLSQGEDIGVVVLARKAGGFLVPTKGATDAVHFVRHHRFAVARTAKDNPAIAFASRHCLRGRSDEKRVIDGIFAERSKILDLMPQRIEEALDFLFV